MLSQNRQRGFSLIELVVVMVVLGLAMSQVVPLAADWLTSLKLRNASESMRNGIEIARQEAVRRNTTVTFWMVSDPAVVPSNSCARSATSPAWVVSGQDPAGQCGADPSTTVAPMLVTRSTAKENATGLTVSGQSSAGGSGDHVGFDGLGQIVVDSSSIQVINISQTNGSGRRARVVVESGGAIRSCDPDVGASDPRACPTTF